MIQERYNEYIDLQNQFADKKRLDQDLVYVPHFFIRYGAFNDLLGVIKKVKPVVQINFHDQKLEEFKKNIGELKSVYGLKCKLGDYKFLINSFKDESAVVDISDPRKGLMSASISFDEKKAERSEDLFLKKSRPSVKSDDYSHQFAVLMGYPECCIGFADKLGVDKEDEEIKRKNLLWSKIRIRSFMESDSFSKLLNQFTINPLIPHTPCNLNCQQSKNYALKMIKIYDQENPKMKELIDYFLELHSLFWHYSEKFLFEGKKEGNSLDYEDFMKISYSGEKFYGDVEKGFREKIARTENLLSKGDQIIMEKEDYKILKEGQVLGSIEKDYEHSCILY